MSLLPQRFTHSAAEETEPRVVGVEDERADELMAALSPKTARRLLSELHAEPATPATLAERADTSLQNTQYHLGKLREAGAVKVIDTAYSEKGREMDIYAPADQPLVVVAGNDEQTAGLRAALSRLLGAVGLLALASLVVQQAFGRGFERLFGLLGGENNGPPASNTSERGGIGDSNGTATTGEPRHTKATPVQGGAKETTPIAGAEETVPVAGTKETSETTANLTDMATTMTANATDAAATVTQTATETAPAAATASADAGLPPGLLFFAGGLLVAILWFVTSDMRW